MTHERILVVHASRLASVLSGLGSVGVGSPEFAVDLALGSWMPECAAEQLRGQLGLESGSRPTALFSHAMHTYADLISLGIDMEAAGRMGVERAYSCAREIAAALPSETTVLVVAPREEAAWDTFDVDFLAFLSELVPSTSRVVLTLSPGSGVPGGLTRSVDDVLLVNDDPATQSAPSATLAALMPGVLPVHLAAELGGVREGLEVAGNRLLVPMEQRPSDGDYVTDRYDDLVGRLAGIGEHQHWLTFARCRGSAYHLDPAELCVDAWERFFCRASQQALGLLAIARRRTATTRPDFAPVVVAHQQGMRIAATRYEEAAAEVGSVPRATPELSRFLIESKGWGMVMSGHESEGEALLERARLLIEESTHTDCRELAYLKNIKALACARRGDLDAAMELERSIAAEIDQGECGEDAQLVYLNQLNTARLHRRLGHPDLARTHFERAFRTCDGLRSLSDAVFADLCVALIAEDTSAWPTAALAWWRTSMHWLSAEVPESLAPRALAGLQRMNHTPSIDPLERTARVLLHKIEEYERYLVPPEDKASAVGATQTDPDIPWHRLTVASRLHSGAVVGVTGWSAVVNAEPMDSPRAWRRSVAELRSRATRIVLAHLPPGAHVGSICVDHNLGRQMPTDRAGVLDSCARLGLDHAVFAGEEVVLTAADRRSLLPAAHVHLAPGVIGVDLEDESAVVHFARYLPPARLSQVEGKVLGRALGQAPRVDQLQADLDLPDLDAVETLLRGMEAQRVICVNTDGTCHTEVEHGARLVPSRV